MNKDNSKLKINHRIWVKSITIGIALLFIKTVLLIAIKQNSNFDIGQAPGRISLIFIIALVVPHSLATDKRNKGLRPLNWFVWLAIALGIWLLGPLSTFIIVTFL